MVISRRSIHPVQKVEEDKNERDQKRCSVCKQLFDYKKIDDAICSEGDYNLHPKSDEEEHFICKDCGKTSINQANKIPCDISKHSGELSRILYIIVIGTLMVLIIGVLWYTLRPTEISFEVLVENQTQDEINFDDELYGLGSIYKRQKIKTWTTFAAGIKSVIAENPNKPSVFLLMYDDDQADNTVLCIIQDVAKAASKYLMKKYIPPLAFAGADLNKKYLINDPGKLLEVLEKPVEKSGSMVITNLEDVHPVVATNFHFLCDRYSPLVEKAVYFFTLKLKSSSQDPLQKVAEDTLESLWAKDLPDNKLHPLITRMTDNVLKIFIDDSNCDINVAKKKMGHVVL